MKKLIKQATIAVAILTLLSGCVPIPEDEAELEGNAPVEVVKKKPASKGTYTSGDLIVKMEAEKNGNIRVNNYYFGGFIGGESSTFVINVEYYGHGFSTMPFYFYGEPGDTFILPISNTEIRIKGFNVRNNTIELEKLN